MSLPSAWTERIFAKLAITYGQRFLGLYAGLDLEAVKANWGYELRGYAQSPDAIRHALDHLPDDKPPTVLEFRALCRRSPAQEAKHLPAPWQKPNPAVLAKATEGLVHSANRYGKAWAIRLRDREARGENLTIAQREMWRDALGIPYCTSAKEPLPDHILSRARQAEQPATVDEVET